MFFRFFRLPEKLEICYNSQVLFKHFLMKAFFHFI